MIDRAGQTWVMDGYVCLVIGQPMLDEGDELSWFHKVLWLETGAEDVLFEHSEWQWPESRVGVERVRVA